MPGSGVFQATFPVALHVSGSAGLSGMTPALGPRNCGQFSCPETRGSVNIRTAAIVNDHAFKASSSQDPDRFEDVPHCRTRQA